MAWALASPCAARIVTAAPASGALVSFTTRPETLTCATAAATEKATIMSKRTLIERHCVHYTIVAKPHEPMPDRRFRRFRDAACPVSAPRQYPAAHARRAER